MRSWALLGLLLAVVSPVRAEEALTLAQCLDHAYQHNGDLRAARTRVALEGERVNEAGSRFMPSAFLDAFYTRYDVEPSVAVDLPADLQRALRGLNVDPSGLRVRTTPQDPWSMKVSLVQPVFTTGKLYNSLQIARAERGATELEQEKARVNVALSVVQAFHDVLLAREAVEANARVATFAEAILATAKGRGVRGIASRMEVLEAEADHARTTFPLLKARNDLQHRESLLKHFMGWDRATPLAVRGDLAWRAYAVDLEELRGEATTRQIDLRLLDQEIAIKEREVTSATLLSTPTVNLTGGYEFLQHQRLDFPDQVFSGGVSMTWPLFDGAVQVVRIRQARLALEEARIRRQHLKEAVEIEVENVYAQLKLAEESYLTHEKLMTAVGERTMVAEASREAGSVSSPELAAEQIALLNARLQGVQLVFDYRLAKARLDHTVGREPEL
jgi:outer membrane protein